MINAVEAADGVTLTGTVEAGSTVSVSLGGVSHAATVDANGNWSVNFTANEIPAGEYMSQITATATDAAGNVLSINDTVEVDTYVAPLAFSATPVEEDNVVNAAEAADGMTLNGTVEVGSVVMVTFEGTTHQATVDAAGNWTVDFAAGEIPAGTYTSEVSVFATDPAGNTRTEAMDLSVDTENPDAPAILSFSQGLQGVRSIGTEIVDDITEVQQISGDGTVSEVNYSLSENTAFNELEFNFNQPIPDGSHLVVTSTDTAGNQAGTYFVLEETGTSTVDLSNPGLGNFDIQAVDLQFANDSQLTITESQLEDLSNFTNELTIHGGDDDAVDVSGAMATGETRDIDGVIYNVYSYGGGSSLIINDEIEVTGASV